MERNTLVNLGLGSALLLVGVTTGIFIGLNWKLSDKKNQPLAKGDNISRGEELLAPLSFTDNKNCYINRESRDDIDEATKYFENENYPEADDYFGRALTASNKNTRDPELSIYKQNAIARTTKNYLTLVAVVPINKKSDTDGKISSKLYCDRGRPILWGIAQAQEEINRKGITIGNKKYYLEIAIANDRNDEKNLAPEIARKIVDDKNILGVIGHNASSATKAALPIYKNNLVAISSTSTASSLGQDMSGWFYRVIPSDEKSSKRLAEYLQAKGISKVSIVYEPGDTYGEGYRESFTKNFSEINPDTKIKEIKFNPQNNNPMQAKQIIQSSLNENIQAILHFTQSTDSRDFSLKIIDENSKIDHPLTMLGGNSLYVCDTLGQNSENLILSVPWVSRLQSAQEFSDRAYKRWGGGIHWRTAASYDALLAFANAIQQNSNINDITRKNLARDIQKVDLSPAETSGSILKFDDKGERLASPPILVKVVKRNDTKSCNGYGFDLIN